MGKNVENTKKNVTLPNKKRLNKCMPNFLGEISCRVDTKGRITMPAKFLKQMALEKEVGKSTNFVINRGIEKCLVIRTMDIWEKVTLPMRPLNDFNVKNRRFIRQFLGGANEVSLDNNNRVLIPKRLANFAGLQKEVILLGCFDKIEIWDVDAYDEMLDIDPVEYAALADEVMGSQTVAPPPITTVTTTVSSPIEPVVLVEKPTQITIDKKIEKVEQTLDNQAVSPKEEEITIKQEIIATKKATEAPSITTNEVADNEEKKTEENEPITDEDTEFE